MHSKYDTTFTDSVRWTTFQNILNKTAFSFCTVLYEFSFYVNNSF